MFPIVRRRTETVEETAKWDDFDLQLQIGEEFCTFPPTATFKVAVY